MKELTTPLDAEEVRSLEVGDPFTITGRIFTARDAAHETLLDEHRAGNEIPVDLENYPCYHAGPVVDKQDGKWNVISAGPTTSIRMEMFEPDFMDAFGTRMFIGKGGMAADTLAALGKHGGVYAQFTGGAGSLAAASIEEVEDVFYLDELGIPEAVWLLDVEEFGPLLVTMDSQGNSLHEEVSANIQKNLEALKSER
jgi:tartrate/fumarate subfamily iron-sulfur-dependent hydro-lyase beta chain